VLSVEAGHKYALAVIFIISHILHMAWVVEYEDAFAAEVAELSSKVRVELAAHEQLLARFGPQLGRPWCDTLKGSIHANMKELRFRADKGVWRVAFAFDPRRRAILLVAGNKRGVNESKFYADLIAIADARLSTHLTSLEETKKKGT
jgi:hypothetical protein